MTRSSYSFRRREGLSLMEDQRRKEGPSIEEMKVLNWREDNLLNIEQKVFIDGKISPYRRETCIFIKKKKVSSSKIGRSSHRREEEKQFNSLKEKKVFSSKRRLSSHWREECLPIKEKTVFLLNRRRSSHRRELWCSPSSKRNRYFHQK